MRIRRCIIGAGIIAGGVFMLFMVLRQSGSLGGATAPQKPYNVIMVAIDTLRVDHMGVYGYARDTSPNLDRFARENIIFDEAIAQAAFTLPSHASNFVSQYPSAHGVTGREFSLNPAKITLAEILKQNNYNTGAFVASWDLGAQYGFPQGFDIYKNVFTDEGSASFTRTIPLAIEWLKQNQSKSSFLFLQGFDVHAPYHKPEPYEHMFDSTYDGTLSDHDRFYLDYSPPVHPQSMLHKIKKKNGQIELVLENETIGLVQRDIDHIIAHYDGGIRYTDNLIQGFFDQLKQMGLYDDAIIIVYAAHGESLGDAMARPNVDNVSLFGHGPHFEELTHVPLFIKLPSGFSSAQAQRIQTQVQLIDLFPTILDILGISQDSPLQEQIQGKSLVRLMNGKGDTDSFEYAYGEGGLRAELTYIRTLQWKLVQGGMLYDLRDDPKEAVSVSAQYQDIVMRLKKEMTNRQYESLQKRASAPPELIQ